MLSKLYFVCFVLILGSTLVVAEEKKTQASLDFDVIPMHYGLLNGKYHSYTDLEGLNGFNVLYDVSQGEQQIVFSVKHNLHINELIAYQAASGKYYVAQIASKTEKSIRLTKPLVKGIAKGVAVWNFYHDGSHPNHAGFNALADFSIAQLKKEELDNKIHAFIGDSWFDEGTFEQRIKSEVGVLQSINKAVGGRTSKETLDAFDKDFPQGSVKPDIFWVSLSTNDYWGDVTPQNFINNIEKIIRKINAMGARAIVLDASVGPLGYDDVKDEMTYIQKDLSDAYAEELKQLYAKYHPTPTVVPPIVPSTTSSGGTLLSELLMLVGLFLVKFKRVSVAK